MEYYCRKQKLTKCGLLLSLQLIMKIVSLCRIEHWISLFDSYACVPVWHLEPGLIAWFDSYWNLWIVTVWILVDFDGLYLDRYVSINCYGVGVNNLNSSIILYSFQSRYSSPSIHKSVSIQIQFSLELLSCNYQHKKLFNSIVSTQQYYSEQWFIFN